MEKSFDVAVLGEGPWGVVLADLLGMNHDQVGLWGSDPAVMAEVRQGRHPLMPGVTFSPALQVVDSLSQVASARVLFLAMGSRTLRKVVHQLGDHLRGDQVLISASRGLEPETAALMTHIITRETCIKKVGCLAGPRLTLEMSRGAPGAGVVASPFQSVIDDVQRRLSSRRYRVYTTTDLVGAEVGSALSGVIALLAGVVEGAELGPGVQAIVLTRGLAEISRLGTAMGARAETFSGLSTLGVLLGACLGQGQSDYQLGKALVRESRDWPLIFDDYPLAEGPHTSRAALTLARQYKVELPLVLAAQAFLAGGASPAELAGMLMARPTRTESGTTPRRGE